MKRSVKKNIFFIFLALVLTGAVAGYFLWNKQHLNVRNAAAVETNAVTLYNIFIDDSAQAKLIYLNKVVKVSGTISGVSLNQKHQKVIFLKTSIADASVNCTMEEEGGNYKTGDGILLKGICAGYIPGDADMGLHGDVFITRCYRSY